MLRYREQEGRGGGGTQAQTALLEPLEPRVLLSAASAAATASLASILVSPNIVATPAAQAGPVAYTPGQIRLAYGFNQITFTSALGQSIVGDGAGQTIAIVDAYKDPNIVNDLKVFDATFGLSNMDGKGAFALTTHLMSSRTSTNSGWAMEIALDVEWAHAMAPAAHILLVEAKSASLSNLLSAVDYARKAAGVVAVSMSWGAGEFLGQDYFDSHFTTPAGHVGGSSLPGGVTFVAASGDSGAGAIYPAVSPNVLAVGGTTLDLSSSGAVISETAWSGSGGGVSQFTPQPAYQGGLLPGVRGRANPDVAYNADPNTGFYVYDSVPYFGQAGWWVVGGTSAGAPQWAALVAIADQARASNGLGSLDSFSQTLPAIYTLANTSLNDIVSGSNGYSAGPGFDLVTGRGSPLANAVVQGLMGGASATAAVGKLGVTSRTGSLKGALSTYAEDWRGQGPALTADLLQSTDRTRDAGNLNVGPPLAWQPVDLLSEVQPLPADTSGGDDSGAGGKSIELASGPAASEEPSDSPGDAWGDVLASGLGEVTLSVV